MVEAVSSKTIINLKLLNQNEIEDLLKSTNAESLWEKIHNVPGMLHVHSVAPHVTGVQTHITTNDNVSTIHSLVDNITLPQTFVKDSNADYQAGDFVIVKYDQKFFPGEILANYDESAEVKVMVSSGPKFWKWPDRDDILKYQWKDVYQCISGRMHYRFIKL